jgi:hypothetical protein
MEITTIVDTRSGCRKKERVQCQGKGVLISGMKITENKSTSMNIIVKTGTVLLEQIVMLSSNPPAGTLIKTVLLPALDRSSLGGSFLLGIRRISHR